MQQRKSKSRYVYKRLHCGDLLKHVLCRIGDCLVVWMVKDLPAMHETWVWSLVKKIPWRRAWQPTPVSLPREFHGQRSLVGHSRWGRKESDTTEWLTVTLEYIVYMMLPPGGEIFTVFSPLTMVWRWLQNSNPSPLLVNWLLLSFLPLLSPGGALCPVMPQASVISDLRRNSHYGSDTYPEMPWNPTPRPTPPRASVTKDTLQGEPVGEGKPLTQDQADSGLQGKRLPAPE